MNNKMNPDSQAAITNLDEIRKMVMQENINGSRLTTLKLPRDLTLGGTKSKKVFTPNLNVIRNKDKAKRVHEPVKSERRSNRSHNNASRQAPKRAKLMQSEGIFSQGIGEGKRATHSSERASSGFRNQTASSTLTMPKINKTWQTIDKKEEKLLLDNLLADQDSDSDSDSDEYSTITLPLEFPNLVKKGKELQSQDIANNIKLEIPDESCQTNETEKAPTLNVKPKVKTENQEAAEHTPFVSFLQTSKAYDDDNPAFAFIKLPNSLPGKIFRDNPNDTNLDATLQDLNDGPIGKIQVRKSGKIELVMKDTTYVLNAEGAGNAINTAVLFPGKESISIEPSLVTLGVIDETFAVTPDWGSIFGRARKNPRFYF